MLIFEAVEVQAKMRGLVGNGQFFAVLYLTPGIPGETWMVFPAFAVKVNRDCRLPIA